MYYPKISIITPSFNQGNYLEKTILSVINQNYPDIEYIIIDGGSTDGSVDIIRKYEKYINYWTSEKDSGQSDAINKGIKKSSGEFITWLNSDDVMMPGSLNEFAETYKKNKGTNWFTGNLIWITTDDKIIKCRKGERWSKILPEFGILNSYGPSSFIRKEIILEVGGLNENLHYMMDTELWWRLAKSGYKFKRLKKYIWCLRLHKDSKMSGHMFNNGETKNPNHPSWTIKNNEYKYIEEKYSLNKNSLQHLIGKILLSVIRIFTPRYLVSYVYSFLYKNKNFLKLKNL